MGLLSFAINERDGWMGWMGRRRRGDVKMWGPGRREDGEEGDCGEEREKKPRSARIYAQTRVRDENLLLLLPTKRKRKPKRT